MQVRRNWFQPEFLDGEIRPKGVGEQMATNFFRKIFIKNITLTAPLPYIS